MCPTPAWRYRALYRFPAHETTPAAGLLAPERMEAILREQLRRRADSRSGDKPTILALRAPVTMPESAVTVARNTERGKAAGAEINNSVSGNFMLNLDEQVQSYLAAKAQAKGIDLSNLVNDLLKREIEMIQAVG